MTHETGSEVLKSVFATHSGEMSQKLYLSDFGSLILGNLVKDFSLRVKTFLSVIGFSE